MSHVPFASLRMSSTLPTVAFQSDARSGADGFDGAPVNPARLLPLSGRNIGILCSDPQRPEAVELQRATTGLGALVALVRPDFGEEDERTGLEQMARVLARFYDAVLCFDLLPSIVQQLGETAAVPVLCVDGGALRERPATRAAAEHDTRLLLSRLASLCA